ncbi:hypothetical protein ACFQU7_20285 [Pseudoroseomonas wenyumeiae]
MPGLAAAAREALERASRSGGLRHAALLALTPADAAEGLLGAETGGLAPAQGPTRFVHGPDGRAAEQPTRAARRAAALGFSAESLLAPVPAAARAAMEAAVRPTSMPPPRCRPRSRSRPGRCRRRARPPAVGRSGA